jgi:SAM-dependent methyltransferase
MSQVRTEAYGQTRSATWVDRFGCWLSMRAIKRHLPLHRFDLKILEVGCGYNATNLVALSPFLREGVGVDFQINPELKNLVPFQFLEMSAEDALRQLKSSTFDCILLISVLEHLENPLFVLKESYRLLKGDGLVLINVPTWLGKKYLEFSAFTLGTSPALEMDDHKMYYDLRDLWPLLVQAQFRPRNLNIYHHKFGLNLFAVARKGR